MKCDRVRNNLSAYIDGELRRRLRKQVARHLRGCAACRREYESLLKTVHLVRALPPQSAPSELFAKVQGALPARSVSQAKTVRAKRVIPFPIWASASGLAAAALILVCALLLVHRGPQEPAPARAPNGRASVPARSLESERYAFYEEKSTEGRKGGYRGGWSAWDEDRKAPDALDVKDEPLVVAKGKDDGRPISGPELDANGALPAASLKEPENGIVADRLAEELQSKTGYMRGRKLAAPGAAKSGLAAEKPGEGEKDEIAAVEPVKELEADEKSGAETEVATAVLPPSPEETGAAVKELEQAEADLARAEKPSPQAAPETVARARAADVTREKKLPTARVELACIDVNLGNSLMERALMRAQGILPEPKEEARELEDEEFRRARALQEELEMLRDQEGPQPGVAKPRPRPANILKQTYDKKLNQFVTIIRLTRAELVRFLINVAKDKVLQAPAPSEAGRQRQAVLRSSLKALRTTNTKLPAEENIQVVIVVKELPKKQPPQATKE